MKGICKVCELVDEDSTTKDIFWCETCKEYICKQCEPNLLKRGLAMIMQKLKRKKDAGSN